MNEDTKITITAKPHDGKRFPWLAGRPMWQWTLDYNGATFDGGGHTAMEVDHAADSAIAKYRQLFTEDKGRRMAANASGRKVVNKAASKPKAA